ncbi:hypothetical protein J437_LFUL002497 [Ladona fulva]|uniref:Mitochondrial inner membrane protein COX18 n=1 Tax=Ladona fulva TaxID=123851 RepID=A0A8K0JXB7_LADFU|nr:hypothetical protein J437_LFUL002497 [Ladona fulva]
MSFSHFRKELHTLPYFYVKCRKSVQNKSLYSVLSFRPINPLPVDFMKNQVFSASVRCFSLQSIVDLQTNLFIYLSQSAPAFYAQKYFETIHDFTELPWWGTILCSTILVRGLIALPLAVYQNYILAKYQNLQVELVDISKELRKEVAYASKKFNWSEKQAQLQYRHSLKRQWDKLIVRENCHPFKASLPIWFQLPMWIFLSISLRNMTYMLPYGDAAAEVLFSQLTVGGCLWFPNLIAADHTLILPITLGLLNLAIVELQTMTKIKEPTKFQKYLTNFFRVLSIAMIPIAANVPTVSIVAATIFYSSPINNFIRDLFIFLQCMSFYWVTSSACGLAQNLLVLSPRLKRWAHIPETKPLPMPNLGKSSGSPDSSPSPAVNIGLHMNLQNHPYRHIASEVQARIKSISRKIGVGKGR